jgi:hypothetical protein
MVIYGVFPNSRPAATERPVRQHSAPEQQAPEAGRPPQAPLAANDSGEPASPSLARNFFGDWWPLIIAGVAVAMLI